MINQKEQFEEWLASMDSFLDVFSDQVKSQERTALDYSIESLNTVEQWILRNYSSADAMLDPNESRRVNGASCYVGEVFRRTGGGLWNIELVDRDSVYYQMPILVKDKPRRVECPLTIVTAAADRRTGDYIQRVLMAWMK